MTIAAYLERLERELRLRRAPRLRLLEEVDHHLRDLADELAGGGLSRAQAEERAIARFGDATVVAAGFAEAAASTTTRRAVRAGIAAFAGYAVVFFVFATAASPLLRDFPQGAASFLAIQVAAVALVVAAVRSLRWRGVVAAPSGELAAIARCLFVVCLALLAAGVCEAGVALSRPTGVIAWSEGRWLTIGFAVAVLLLLASGLSARAGAQASAVAALPTQRERTRAESLAANVDALLRGTRLPAVRRIALTALARPWQTMSLTAVAAFLAVTAAGFREGLAGAVVLGAVETTVILVAFVTLGGLLGLREGPTQSRRAG
jgi:HAAS domain-containing protein